MRIGIDVRLQNESGVGRYIRNLVKHLSQIDKKNEYILLDPDVMWHTFQEQIVMPYIFLRRRLDLVHFPYFNVPILYPGKFVVTIHDLTISHFDTGRSSTLNPLLYKVKRQGYRFVMWNAVKRADKIIVPTNAVKSDILHNYKIDAKRIFVIYEGIDSRLATLGCKLDLKIGSKLDIKTKMYFLYVGNAYPHKNLEKLLFAFKKAIEQLNNRTIKLVLAGKEDFFYKRLKKRVKELRLWDDVIFTGYVTDRELSWLYQNALALVFPTLMEGFGLSAVEAMHNKCLVLASDIPALKEVCHNAAIYFNPNDIDSIAGSMLGIVEHPSGYRTKILQGRQRATQFLWTKTAQETLRVYESSISI